jgi:hypothetical protein
LVLAGCGRIGFEPVGDATPVDPDDGAHSGARLKLVWNTFDDGFRQVASVYDTQLAVGCRPITLSSGYVCVPDHATLYFTDATCTTPVMDPTCRNYQYALNDLTHVYQRAGVSAATSFYRFSGTCQGPFGALGTLYDVTEIAVSTLDPLVVTQEPGGRLQPQFYEDADGFRLQTAPYDTMLATTCLPQSVSAGTLGCTPLLAADASYALDSNCTQHVAVSVDPVATPQFAALIDYSGCLTTDLQHFSIGAEIGTPANLYRESTTGCAPMTIANARYFQLGPQLSLATMTREHGTVAGRRMQPVYNRGDSVTYRASSMYDSQLDGECGIGFDENGTTRCLLTDLTISSFYSDASCTSQSDFGFEAWFNGCAAPPLATRGTKVASVVSQCEVHLQVVGLASEHGPAFTGTTAMCTPYSLADEMVRFYDLGAPIDPAEFALSTLIMDP